MDAQAFGAQVKHGKIAYIKAPMYGGNMIIRKYTHADQDGVMNVISGEGGEWECYSAPDVAEKYRRLLDSSITYVAELDGHIVGYSRSLMDGAFCIYICDLLVDKRCRGQHTGSKLMECICDEYPSHEVYVMSDVDEYYTKQGYRREGSVFMVERGAR